MKNAYEEDAENNIKEIKNELVKIFPQTPRITDYCFTRIEIMNKAIAKEHNVEISMNMADTFKIEALPCSLQPFPYTGMIVLPKKLLCSLVYNVLDDEDKFLKPIFTKIALESDKPELLKNMFQDFEDEVLNFLISFMIYIVYGHEASHLLVNAEKLRANITSCDSNQDIYFEEIFCDINAGTIVFDLFNDYIESMVGKFKKYSREDVHRFCDILILIGAFYYTQTLEALSEERSLEVEGLPCIFNNKASSNDTQASETHPLSKERCIFLVRGVFQTAMKQGRNLEALMQNAIVISKYFYLDLSHDEIEQHLFKCMDLADKALKSMQNKG